MAPTLAYWSIRGLAQPVRLLLAHVGQEFEDKKYECGPAPTFDKSCWFDEKPNLGLDFPNLPYYVDGDVKLTQSTAILRFLADKHDLNATTEQERVRLYVAEYQVADFRSEFVRLCYNPNMETVKDEYVKNLTNSLKAFSEFLGKNKYLAGEKLTYVDFMFYEVLDHHRLFKSDCLDEFSNLKEYMGRFEALPNIAEYMKSDKFMKAPLNNKMAKFGQE